VIGDPQRVGDDRQGRVDRANRGEKARVRHIQIVELVRLAIRVEHRCCWVGAKPQCARLVRGAPNWDVLAEIKRAIEQVGVDVNLGEKLLELVS